MPEDSRVHNRRPVARRRNCGKFAYSVTTRRRKTALLAASGCARYIGQADSHIER
jgi:hypothetical protein